MTRLNYDSLVTKFNERTKRKYDKKQLKNRWETLKKDYTVWKGLLQHASGLGFDPHTRTIDASDDWWTHEIQMCPEAAKFRIAPLQDEEDLKILFDKNVVTNTQARVPPTSQVRASASRINIEGDVEGSGCEGEEDPLVTPVRAKKNRACPYSPIPTTTPKMSIASSSAARLDRMVEMMELRQKDREREEEKSKSKNSRDEIRRLVALVYQDGAAPGSVEYYGATQLFLLQEYREMFACLVEDATPAQRIDWIKMTWERFSKK